MPVLKLQAHIDADLSGKQLQKLASRLAEKRNELALRVEDLKLQIVVKDEGRGISPNKLEGITDFGFTTKSGQTRTGLRMGLPYAKRVTDEVGGYLSIESEVGVGSTFRFSLPSA